MLVIVAWANRWASFHRATTARKSKARFIATSLRRNDRATNYFTGSGAKASSGGASRVEQFYRESPVESKQFPLASRLRGYFLEANPEPAESWMESQAPR